MHFGIWSTSLQVPHLKLTPNTNKNGFHFFSMKIWRLLKLNSATLTKEFLLNIYLFWLVFQELL